MHACMQRRKDQTNLVFHFMLMTHCFNREQLKKKKQQKKRQTAEERERERAREVVLSNASKRKQN